MTRPGTEPFALELRKISKRFGPVRANHEVDLQIRPGEIRGLVGENGAGKSTLMAIASGLYSPDAGEVLVGDVAQQFKGRDAAIALGINMVHQHFMLVPTCTVAQNVVLGQPGKQLLPLAEIERAVAELAGQYGIEVDPRARIEDLTPTERQRVEIITALWRGRTLLILDEPTSVLGPADVKELFSTMRRVASEGCAIVFTSHKLGEVIEVCDAISVMRHGEMQTTISRGEADVEALATLMVGKRLAADSALVIGGAEEAQDAAARRAGDQPAPVERGAVVARIADDGTPSDRAPFGTLEIAAGEILGIAGVEGNGQLALAETLAGLVRADGCTVELNGRDITDLGPRERAELGIAYVPEDPNASALVPAFPVMWNLSLRDYRPRKPAGRRRWFVDMGTMRELAVGAIRQVDIRGAGPDTRTAALSGGNQQKVVLARELARSPHLLVIVDPTVGLDVGASQGVHDELRKHRDRGAAVVLISTDLDEIETLSDRIAVLYRGSIVGVAQRENAHRRELGL
jgi:ABC-type uncharacterized transport system ATPase subunit